MRYLAITSDAAEARPLLVECWFGRCDQHAFDLIQRTSHCAADSFRRSIPTGERAVLIDSQKTEPTEVMPAVSESITAVGSQPVEQARVALSRLTDIDRSTTFIVENVDADLIAEIDYLVAASAL